MEKKNRDRLNNFFIVFAFIFVFFLVVNQNGSKPSSERIKKVSIGGQSVNVDLAITPAELSAGLSGRASLNSNAGMLFIFDKPGKYNFWMKDMNFALDMIWIAEDMKVIYIKKDARPAKFLDTYGPDKEAKYVLEVMSGFSDKNNLKEGDSVVFTY